MTPVAWMVGTSLGAWLVATVVAGRSFSPEVFAGMIGPLVTAVATWVRVVRVHAVSPERLTSVLVAGFGAKMVFFGAYVIVALRGLGLRPIPFVVSFAGFFITLHVMEALFLRRLFEEGSRSEPGARHS
jgi:hypothetical protein